MTPETAQRIKEAGRDAQRHLGVTDADVAFSLDNARRIHPAWGGAYSVEGSRPDRWPPLAVVRLTADADGDVVEVLGLY